MHDGLSRHLFEIEAHIVRRLAPGRNWTLHTDSYPMIEVTFSAVDRTPLRVRMECIGSPREPVSFLLLRADGSLLPAGPSPEIHPNTTGVLNGGPHSSEPRPFVCTPGSREYHAHESHLNESWDSYRTKDAFKPAAMLTQVWRAWQKGTG